MGGWLLTLTILAPLAASLALLLVPARRGLLIRLIAAAGALATLPAAVWLCANYDQARGGFQFAQKVAWVPSLGIAYHVAVDGTSLALILLTAIIVSAGVFASWTQTNRTKEFLSLLLLLVSGVFGVFASRDLFFLFLFYEIAVLPMYLLIGVWGTSTRERTKEHSAMKLTLMLLGGSAFILVAILALYLAQPVRSFDLDVLAGIRRSAPFQRMLFLLVYIGFGVLAGIWPLHTWSPDGHASAPTAVSMLHAGVLMKLGAYGVLRIGVELLPEGAQHWAFLVGCIATVNILYGAMAAMAQTDLKYVIAYSSVSHMGVVMLGLASMNRVGINGSVMQMFSHGIMTGLFFACVGLIYEKSHTRDTLRMGGFAQRMPGIAVVMTIGGLASFGLPATSGFVAEFLAFYGMWLRYPVLALLSVCGIVITAVYVLRVIQRVFLGAFRDGDYADLRDARTTEWVAIGALALLLLVVGMWPKPLVSLIDAGVSSATLRHTVGDRTNGTNGTDGTHGEVPRRAAACCGHRSAGVPPAWSPGS
ncbi:MAG: NADH-quinone oxidoreductase subunit M [Armatimonadetes bacterium]|nr:NADH-quinone oxidoreductase subunit M [Armatimonadota bacterium]